MSHFEPDQRRIMEALWKISEEAWSAGWKQDLEFEVWRMLETGPGPYGGMRIEAETLRELRALADAAGGWIHFDPVEQETWVDARKWDSLYAAWSSRPA